MQQVYVRIGAAAELQAPGLLRTRSSNAFQVFCRMALQSASPLNSLDHPLALIVSPHSPPILWLSDAGLQHWIYPAFLRR